MLILYVWTPPPTLRQEVTDMQTQVFKLRSVQHMFELLIYRVSHPTFSDMSTTVSAPRPPGVYEGPSEQEDPVLIVL